MGAVAPLLITFEDYTGVLGCELAGELDTDLAGRYGSGNQPVLVPPGSFSPAARGGFWVARTAGAALGCVALASWTATVGELKRMYVRPAARGRGLARALLAHCEQEARALGYAELWLETGWAQPEAVALYESAGYHRVPGFGQFGHEDGCFCYGRHLCVER